MAMVNPEISKSVAGFRLFRSIGLCCLLTGLLVLSNFVYKTEKYKLKLKSDLIELSNIKYGLFNVDEWKNIITDILNKKVEEFELSNQSDGKIKNKISDLLYTIITNLEERTHEQNRGSLKGYIKNSVVNFTGIFQKMKDDVPVFSNEILSYVNHPENKKQLKLYISSKLNEYADKTYSKLDYSVHDSIIEAYHAMDRKSAITLLNAKLYEAQNELNLYKIILAAIFFLAIIYVYSIVSANRLELIVLTLICFVLLFLGLLLPMIEIDARISEFDINLLGEHIYFNDQVIYYKSKSILEVVHLMLTQGGYDLLFVGLLVLIFSVMFPLLKLISAMCIILIPKLREQKLIRFFVYKTGKWSMADVMVVAIFIAYIGFSGIITEQLNQLEYLNPQFDVLTTNHSSLQIGFFAFTAFTILSLVFTHKLNLLTKNKQS